MSARATILALTVGATLAATGCARAVVFTTTTSTGLELNALEGVEQTVRFGYERREGVTMPGRKSDGTVSEGTYPVFSLYEQDSGSFLLSGLGTMKLRQLFVTGKAAVIATGGQDAVAPGAGTGALPRIAGATNGVQALGTAFEATGRVFEER